MAPFFQQDLDSVSPLTCLGCESDRVFFASLSTRRLGPIQLQLCYYRYLNFTGTSCPNVSAQLSISTNPTRKGVSFTREEKDGKRLVNVQIHKDNDGPESTSAERQTFLSTFAFQLLASWSFVSPSVLP